MRNDTNDIDHSPTMHKIISGDFSPCFRDTPNG